MPDEKRPQAENDYTPVARPRPRCGHAPGHDLDSWSGMEECFGDDADMSVPPGACT